LVERLFVCVETKLYHAERYGTSHEYIAAANCFRSAINIENSKSQLTRITRYCAFRPNKWVYELRIVNVLGYCARNKYDGL
jgi:hypothetical protein